MGDVKELKIRSLEDAVNDMKELIKKFFNTNNVKFVGIEFHFLVDDEVQAKYGFFAKGYDPHEFEEVESYEEVVKQKEDDLNG